MTDIFLSYSSKDREQVRPIRDALAAAGYDVFWDQEVPTGVNWNKWIMDHLSRSRLVVVAWSKNSVASDNVIHEATIAREDGKLAPCLLEVLTTRDFPMGFYTTQAAPLHDWTGQAAHKGYQDLMTAIRTRLGGGAAAAQAVQQNEAADIADLRRWAEAGEASAQLQLGYHYDTGSGVAKNAQEAVRLYKLAADQGHALAQSHLGWMYANGDGVANDDREAVRLFRLAADQGDVDAQSHLGWMYDKGRGVTKNDREAARFYRLAADRGNAAAQFNLGAMYAVGRGVAKDDREAMQLYKLAVDQGSAAAQISLGNMYALGRGGLPEDHGEAMRLWKLAAANGNEHAQTFLKSKGETW